MIWLLPHPLPVNKLPLFHSLSVCRRSSLLTGEGGTGCGRRRSQVIRRRENLVLYNPLKIWICEKILFVFSKVPLCQITQKFASMAYLWKSKKSLFVSTQNVRSVAKFLVPHCETPMPESTISRSQGLRIWLLLADLPGIPRNQVDFEFS
jgi:hypothetical protein